MRIKIDKMPDIDEYEMTGDYGGWINYTQFIEDMKQWRRKTISKLKKAKYSRPAINSYELGWNNVIDDILKFLEEK